jgi:hypothetical protein
LALLYITQKLIEKLPEADRAEWTLAQSFVANMGSFIIAFSKTSTVASGLVQGFTGSDRDLLAPEAMQTMHVRTRDDYIRHTNSTFWGLEVLKSFNDNISRKIGPASWPVNEQNRE